MDGEAPLRGWDLLDVSIQTARRTRAVDSVLKNGSVLTDA
jgi:hypothetical protein